MNTDDLLDMYAVGYFPMAEHRDDSQVLFYAPKIRALLPIDLHIPRRLKRTALKFPFEITVDTKFEQVICACADVRETTWINDTIINLYTELHYKGFAHSIECWKEGLLVGGLYGVAMGGTFCGESMFSHATDASKIALIHLCSRLKRGGFTILDSQFRNPHLDQFGLYEMSQKDYVAVLQSHLADTVDFGRGGIVPQWDAYSGLDI